jgi:uncharacterized protein (TIGR00369 family)
MTERQAWTAETVQQYLDGSPHIAFLALVCDEADAATGTVALRMPLRPELARSASGEQFHGGPVASFIDTAGDFAISLLVSAPVPTVNLRVDYLRPATGPFLLARATARRAGRTIGVADIDVLDSAGRLVAIGRGTYATAAG